MAQNTRRGNRPAEHVTVTPEQNAMARELYNMPYPDLRKEDREAVDTALTAEVNTPEDVTGEGSIQLPSPAAGDTDPTGDSSSADSQGVTAPESGAKVTPADVRTWAQLPENVTQFQGVPSHGRLPEEITTAYKAAHPGHEIVSAPSNGSSNKALIAVPEDAVAFEEVPEDEWGSHPLADRPMAPPRDAVQVRFDERVKAIYDKWVAAGKPPVEKAPRDRIRIDPKYGPATRRMLGAAATFHKVALKAQPIVHDQEGRQVIVFTAIDKPVKPKPEEKPEEKPEPATAE